MGNITSFFWSNNVTFNFDDQANKPIDPFLLDMGVTMTESVCPFRHEYYRYLELKKMLKDHISEDDTVSHFVQFVKSYDGKISWKQEDGCMNISGYVKYFSEYHKEERTFNFDNFNSDKYNQSLKLGIYESLIITFNRLATNILEGKQITNFSDTIVFLNSIDPKEGPFEITKLDEVEAKIELNKFTLKIKNHNFEQELTFTNL